MPSINILTSVRYLIILFLQLVVCLRYVEPHSYEVFEDCIGLYSTDKTNANQLTDIIKDVIIRTALTLRNCRSLRYDGAPNMSGIRSDIATPTKKLQHWAVHLHNMGNFLNLAVQIPVVPSIY